MLKFTLAGNFESKAFKLIFEILGINDGFFRNLSTSIFRFFDADKNKEDRDTPPEKI